MEIYFVNIPVLVLKSWTILPSCVTSCLDYCNSLLNGITTSSFNFFKPSFTLQPEQNRNSQIEISGNITALLDTLQGVPTVYMIKFKLLQ